jgi:hypothetical protein
MFIHMCESKRKRKSWVEIKNARFRHWPTRLRPNGCRKGGKGGHWLTGRCKTKEWLHCMIQPIGAKGRFAAQGINRQTSVAVGTFHCLASHTKHHFAS